jgi:hypothetical protein
MVVDTVQELCPLKMGNSAGLIFSVFFGICIIDHQINVDFDFYCRFHSGVMSPLK